MQSFKGRENLFFCWHQKTLDLVDCIAENEKNNRVTLNNEFLKFYKQYLRSKIAPRLRGIVQSGNSCEELELYDVFFNGKWGGRLNIHEYVRSLMHRSGVIFYVIFLFVKGMIPFVRRKKHKCSVLVLPYHVNWTKDPELHYLLDNIEDSKVVLKKSDQLFGFVDVVRVVNGNGGYLTVRNTINILYLLYLALVMFFSRKELFDAVIRYLHIKAYYMSLSNIVDASMVAVVRGDMSLYSSIIREVFNNDKTPVFSWSHSVYFYREYYLAGVDFDYYCASTPFELDLYKEYWSKDSKYTFIGQQTYPSIDGRFDEVYRSYSGFNGIFSTSIDSGKLPNTLSNFIDFVEAVVLSSSIIDGGFFYKSKNNYKIQRGEDLEDESIQAEEYALSRFPTMESEFEIVDDGVAVSDLVSLINIAFVYSMSTVAFELLQNHVKVVIYWPFPAQPHPLSKDFPLLIARDAEEMLRNALVLDQMASKEYSAYIRSYTDCFSFSIDNKDDILIHAIEDAMVHANNKKNGY